LLRRHKDVRHVLQPHNENKITKNSIFNEQTLSSHSRGRCSKISRGSVSAAMMITSAIPRFRVLVAAQGND
jgi:hypothetical protein